MFFPRSKFPFLILIAIAVVQRVIVRNRKGSRGNAFIRRNVLSVESEGGKEKKMGRTMGGCQRARTTKILAPCCTVYIYIYI